MPSPDSFQGLARFYDPIMQHVNYDRWYLVAVAVARLLPRHFRHLDAACGTGVLLEKLWANRWNSYGFDLSESMLRSGRRSNGSARVLRADMRAVPVHGAFDYVTCLFDSVNFLLTERDLYAGIAGLAGALKPGGILYFDVVTEKMVLDHFAGQRWTESNDRFSTTWSCEYDRGTCTAETRIRINTGAEYTLYERVYPLDLVLDAIETAGCGVLGASDAETWKRPSRRTVRIDIVSTLGGAHSHKRVFRGVASFVQQMLS